MMLVLTIIGIAANRNTSIELQIAGNDRTQKESFYEADGATELAQEVLEQNIACLFFPAGHGGAPGGGAYLAGYGNDRSYDIIVDNDSLDFWRYFAPIDIPTEDAWHFTFPAEAGVPKTRFTVGGSTKLTTGAAIQMAAGYEGRGKGIGTGGVTLVYEIYANHYGRNNSESLIYVEYSHVIPGGGECNYE